MKKLKKTGLVLLVMGYVVAGVNHFRVPDFYISIVPPYLSHPEIINIVAGCCEIALGILLVFAKTRQVAAWCIILMLIAFIPVHLQMVLHTPYSSGHLTVSPWLA